MIVRIMAETFRVPSIDFFQHIARQHSKDAQSEQRRQTPHPQLQPRWGWRPRKNSPVTRNTMANMGTRSRRALLILSPASVHLSPCWGRLQGSGARIIACIPGMRQAAPGRG